MSKYSYIVPTHRNLQKNFFEFSEEILFANKKYNVDIPFVILDDTFKNNSYNKVLVNENRNKHADLRYIYINNNIIQEILDTIKEKLSPPKQDIFLSLYPKGIKNYGSLFNRSFIIAMLLGSDYIFRRDSDVYLQPNHENFSYTEKYLYPIEIEMDNLSKKIEGKYCYISGGGYNGNYGIDIEIEEEEKDFVSMKEFFNCVSIPENQYNEIINLEILTNNKKFDGDSIVFNSYAYPDCGNSAYFELFKHVPCSPAPYVSGTDYFLLEVSLALELRVGYHNRAAIHRYSEDRYDSFDKLFEYWKGIAMLVDLKALYKKYYQLLSLSKDYFINGELGIESLNNTISQIFRNFYSKLSVHNDYRDIKFEAFCNWMKKQENRNQQKLVDLLRTEKNQIFRDTEKNLILHIDLIEIWKEVSDIIRNIKGTQRIEEILKQC